MSLKAFLLISLLLSVSLRNLQAQDSRKIIDFNDNWLFDQDDWIGYFHASSMKWDESTWIPVRTPHSFNSDDTFDNQRGYYRGFAWYRKHFTVPETEKGRILKIHFGAIGNESEIWVNEKFMGKFTTGYTPIDVDITHVVEFGKENLMAVRVNNLHNDEIPPGRWRMDYDVYGGIYREVSLLSLSPVHLVDEDFFVTTPVVAEDLSEVMVSASIKNSLKKNVKAELRCSLTDGVRELAKFSRTLAIPANQSVPVKDLKSAVKDIRLWSTDYPKLYLFRAALFLNGNQVDALEARIGFRNFLFDPEKGFFLNGNPLKLHGLNRHQCFPGLANAVPERLQIEDAILLKELGANFVRCSHYPQHVSFLNACDSLGIMVYEEVASWQHIGGRKFIDHMDYMMGKMIRRDRNHPSVILWGMMNEGRSHEMFEKLNSTAKNLDNTRPVSYAENHIDLGIKEGTIFQPDVLGLNYDVEKYDQLHRDYPEISLINTESTNADKSGLGDLRSQLAATFKIEKDLDFIETRPYMSGICIWSFHDYGSDYEPVWPLQTSGVVSEYRELKEPAWYLKSRWNEKPFVHIAGQWSYPGEEGKIKEVYVWSNCDQTDLFLNGKKLINNSGNVWKVPYQPGELKVSGKKGLALTEHVVRTPGKAAQIMCTPKYTVLEAGRVDALQINARITDNKGIPVPVNGKKITFRLEGPGMLTGIGGLTEVMTSCGSANILVQSTGEKGEIVIKAFSDGLKSGSIVIRAH